MKITKKTAAMLCALGMCLSTMPKNVQAEEEIIEDSEIVAQDVTEEEIIEEAETTEEAADELPAEEADNDVIAAEESFHYEIEENEHAEITVSRSNLGPNEYEVRVFPEEGYESWGIEIVNEAGEDVKFPTCTNVLALFFLTENVTIRAAVHPKDAVTYVDENGTRYVVPEYTDMSQVSDTDGVTLTDGWYVVSQQEVFQNRININGDVNLVLLDDAALNANMGIHNGEASNGHLTIWASSLGERAGVIEIEDTVSECAQIGGNENENGGTINIHGGKIYADCGGGYGAAGIGGGQYGNGGHINIYGGDINAKGPVVAAYGAGAGIGGGEDRDGGVINIYGGRIIAYGGNGKLNGASAGIGGGDEGTGGEINIYGGSVIANGASSHVGSSAGIGGGDNVDGGRITIYGGEINAHSESGGAAIGGGDNGSSGIIKIYGGDIRANSRGFFDFFSDGVGAAIGSGDEGEEAYVEIHGGEIYVESKLTDAFFENWQGAGIGSGNDGGKATVLIDGGFIDAVGWEAIGAGNGADDDEVYITLGDRMHVDGAQFNDRITAVRKGRCVVRELDD